MMSVYVLVNPNFKSGVELYDVLTFLEKWVVEFDAPFAV